MVKKKKSDDQWFEEITDTLDLDIELGHRNPTNLTFMQVDWLLKQYKQKRALEMEREEWELAMQTIKDSYRELESAVVMDMNHLDKSESMVK